MSNQTRTSAGTSINSEKLPAIYGKLEKHYEDITCMPLTYALFIDYGCGRYTDHIEKWARDHQSSVFPYDPYNQPESVNQRARIAGGAFDIDFTVCSNVLNVIDDDQTVRDVIADAVYLGNGTAFFTVYEGNGTGVGSETQNGQSWQRNLKLKEYARFIPDGLSVFFKYGMMIVIDLRKEESI